MEKTSRLKALIQNYLNIKESTTNNTITIQDMDSIAVRLFKNELWYRGDPSELHQFYTKYYNKMAKTMFWQGESTTGVDFIKVHTGLPGIIIDTLVDIVVDDLNEIVILSNEKDEKGNYQPFPEPTQRWKKISEEHDFNKSILKNAVKWALMGDCAFKISFDREISEHPIIEVIPGKDCDYQYKRGRYVGTKFYSTTIIDNKKLVLEETYDAEGVWYKLFNEEGKEMSVSMIEELYDLYPFAYNRGDLPIMAIPFVIMPSSKYIGRGKGILESKEGALDNLDEAWSQWVEALRDGKTRTYIPETLVPTDPLTGQLLPPNTFDRRFIAVSSNMAENANNNIQVESPTIQSESYLATYITALDLCLQGVISPSTLGIDVKKLDNAEAQREKEKATLYTRSKIVSVLEEIIPKLVALTLQVDDYLNNNKQIRDYNVSVSFGEYANPSFESKIETVAKARSGKVMSIERSVEELYGDSLTKEEKEAEIKRLKIEEGYTFEEPGINQSDGTEDGKEDGIDE